MDPLPRRPFPLILVAIAFTILGTLVLLLAVVVGLQIITWDVKGILLTGRELALFSLAVAFVGLLGLGAAVSLWQGRSAGRFLALGFWAGAGLLGLVTDRSVAGPGEPLQTYLVTMMLVPREYHGASSLGTPFGATLLPAREPARSRLVERGGKLAHNHARHVKFADLGPQPPPQPAPPHGKRELSSPRS